jgi:hypothetical protein
MTWTWAFSVPSLSSMKFVIPGLYDVTLLRKHGTFRPTLLPLVRSNDPSAVLTVTASAMNTVFSQVQKSKSRKVEDPIPGIKILTSLKGIGPATASLILAVAFPQEVPFFGDELFEWLCGGGGAGKRKMKYDVKEYKELWEEVKGFRERLGEDGEEEVRADEVEMVGFVCEHWGVVGEAVKIQGVKDTGKGVEEKGGDKGEEKGEEKGEIADAKTEQAHEKEAEPKEGRKRKAKDGVKMVERVKKQVKKQTANGDEEGPRRSKRFRK